MNSENSSLLFRRRSSARFRTVFRQPGIEIIGVEQPHASIAVVMQQLFIPLLTHVACPHDFLLVDIGAVVHSFQKRIMVLSVSHEHEVRPWKRA